MGATRLMGTQRLDSKGSRGFESLLLLDRRRFNRYLFTDCANRKGQIENEEIGSAHHNPNFFRSFETCVRHANFECHKRQIREVVNAVRARVRRTRETDRRVACGNFRTRDGSTLFVRYCSTD